MIKTAMEKMQVGFDSESDDVDGADVHIDNDEPEDVLEDLFIASAGPIHLKTYAAANLTP